MDDGTVDPLVVIIVSLTESLDLDDAVAKTLVVSLTESLDLNDAIARTIPVSLTESLDLDDGTVDPTVVIIVSLTESLDLDDAVAKTLVVSLEESLDLDDGIIELIHSITVTLTESLPLDAVVQTAQAATVSLTESLDLVSSETDLINIKANQELIEDGQTTVIVTEDNKELVVTSSDALLSSITIDASDVAMNYTRILLGPASAPTATITNGWTAVADIDDSTPTFDVEVKLTDSTTITGPVGWNGILKLPTFTPTTILATETDTFSDITAIEIGVASDEVTFDKPVRIEFTGDGGQGLEAFFKRAGDTSVTFITTDCTIDGAAGLGGADECVYDDGTDLIVWTTHFTAFGAAKRSSTSTGSTSSTSSAGGSPGGSSGGSSGGVSENPATITPKIPGGATFYKMMENEFFVINYQMPGENASITDMKLDKPGKSVIFSLSNVQAGMMTLSIPRGLIIATNDNFRVLVSASPETQTQYEIVTSTTEYVSIKLDLPESASELRVVGTVVLPKSSEITIVQIYQVSWDVCESNIVNVIVGPKSDNISVNLRTTDGIINPKLVEEQPYDNMLIFEASVPQRLDYVVVVLENVKGRIASVDQKSINLNECTGSITFAEPPIKLKPVVETSVDLPDIGISDVEILEVIPPAAAVILVPELVLLQIWNEREDLQSKFPEVEYGKYDGIRNWAETIGWNEDERLSKLIPEGETTQYAQVSKTRCGPGTILQDGVCNLEPSKEPVNLKYSVLVAIILIVAAMIAGLYIKRVSRRKKNVPQ